MRGVSGCGGGVPAEAVSTLNVCVCVCVLAFVCVSVCVCLCERKGRSPQGEAVGNNSYCSIVVQLFLNC